MHGSDTDTWDKLVALKQKQIADDIPLEWRLPSTLIEKFSHSRPFILGDQLQNQTAEPVVKACVQPGSVKMIVNKQFDFTKEVAHSRVSSGFWQDFDPAQERR